MTTSEYGLYTSLLAVTTLIISLGGGIQTVLIRGAAAETFFDMQWEHILFSIKFQFAIIFIFSLLSFFLVDDLIVFTGLILYCIGVSGFNLLSIGQQAIKNLNIYAFLGISRNLIIILLVFLIGTYYALKSVYIFYIYGTTSLTFLVIFLLIYSKKTITKPRLNIGLLIKDNAYLIIYYAIISIYTQLDVILATIFLPSEKLAQYGVGLRYYYLSLLFLPPIVNSIRIYTSSNGFEKDTFKQVEYLKDWALYSAPIIISLGIMVFFASPFILNFLNGTNYNDATIIFKYMLLGSVASYLFSPIISLLITNSCYSILIKISVFSVIFKAILFWCFLSLNLSVKFLGLGFSLSILYFNLYSAYQYSHYLKNHINS